MTSRSQTFARTIGLYHEHLLAVFEQLQRDEVFRSRLEVEGIKTDAAVAQCFSSAHGTGLPRQTPERTDWGRGQRLACSDLPVVLEYAFVVERAKVYAEELRPRVALQFYFPNGNREQRRGPRMLDHP